MPSGTIARKLVIRLLLNKEMMISEEFAQKVRGV
jgi:hypothetical protein